MAIASVYGQVVDGATGIPVYPGTASLDIGFQLLTTELYPDGYYLIDWMPGSGYIMTFHAPGYEELVVPNLTFNAYTFTHVPVTMKKLPAPTPSDAEDWRKYFATREAGLLQWAKAASSARQSRVPRPAHSPVDSVVETIEMIERLPQLLEALKKAKIV